MASAATHPGLRGNRAGAVALVAMVVLAYLPALRAGFVWDDDMTVTHDRFLQEPGWRGLHDLWLTAQPADYWPATSTALWLEWRLWGPHPAGYHAVNLALHAAEAVLIWRILRSLRVPGAWVGAALFAVHPVNVESVAWIAQLKNLLAMVFYLASVRFFLSACSGSGREALPEPSSPLPDTLQINSWYWISLGSFVLAMLSKGSVAILPLVLIGIVAWKRRVGGRDVWRLMPFFTVAAVLSAVNVWFAGHHLLPPEVIRAAGPLQRLLGAGAVVWFYLWKAVYPAHLAFFYPQWHVVPADPLWWIPLLAAVAVTAVLIKEGGIKVGRLVPNPPGALGTTRPAFIRPALSHPARALLFAWLYFCVALIPVMGFTDVYFMRYSLVADHYEHLALIGVTALAGAGWGAWRRRSPSATWAAAIAIGLLAALAFRQCLAYRDAESLLRWSLGANPRSAAAQNNLGVILAGRREWPQAEARFERAVDLDPDFAEAQRNLAVELDREGRLPEAISHYQAALRLETGPSGEPETIDALLLKMQLEEAQRLKAERRAQAAAGRR